MSDYLLSGLNLPRLQSKSFQRKLETKTARGQLELSQRIRGVLSQRKRLYVLYGSFLSINPTTNYLLCYMYFRITEERTVCHP